MNMQLTPVTVNSYTKNFRATTSHLRCFKRILDLEDKHNDTGENALSAELINCSLNSENAYTCN